jgi:hypothetical protein
LAEEQARVIDERLATKADLESLRLVLRTDLDALRLATKTDLDALRLATKADLEALRLATKTDLEALRMTLEAGIAACATKSDLSEAKADILKWIIGSIGFQTLVIVGAALTLAKMAAH